MNQRPTEFDPMSEKYWRFARRSPSHERNIPFDDDADKVPAEPRWRSALAAIAWALAAAAVVVVASPSDARADAIAMASDSKDRRIILTDEDCDMKEYSKVDVLRAVAVIRGQLYAGCWGRFKYDDSQIVLLFPNGVSAVMGTSQFMPVKNNN